MMRALAILEGLFAALAVSLSLTCVVMASDPTTFGLDLFATGILTIAGFVLALVARVVWAFRNSKGQRLRALLRIRIVLPLLPAAVIVAAAALIESEVPFHARFAWSRAALESAAHDARQIERRAEGDWRWIGLFRIHGVQIDRQGRTHFDLGGCAMLDRCELVFDPAHSDSSAPRHGRPINESWWIFFDPF